MLYVFDIDCLNFCKQIFFLRKREESDLRKHKRRKRELKLEMKERTKSVESKKSRFSEHDLKKAQCALELSKLQKKLMKYT